MSLTSSDHVGHATHPMQVGALGESNPCLRQVERMPDRPDGLYRHTGDALLDGNMRNQSKYRALRLNSSGASLSQRLPFMIFKVADAKY
jgi:hypothetical protein